MNGFIALAHTPPHFHDTFYATAATVIPVLFLAIAVQPGLYGDLLGAARRASLRADRGVRTIKVPGMGLAYITWGATWGLALIILVVGIYGELAAIYALYVWHLESLVFLSIAILVVVAAIAPAWALGSFLVREARGPKSRASADSATKPPSAESVAAPGESTLPESGKPGT